MRKERERTYRLTASDLRILQEIDKHGFRNYAELRATVLKTFSRQWSWNKMNRLTKMNYIFACRGGTGEILGWKLVSKNVNSDLHLLKNEKISNLKAPSYTGHYIHDQEVRFVLDSFEKLTLCKKIDTESTLRSALFSKITGYSKSEMNELNAYVPDGAVTLELAGKLYNVAIEVELNPKTTMRLRKKLERYIAKNEFDFIFFICGGDYVFQGMVKNYHHVLENSALVRITENKTPIYFSHLIDLKKDFLNAKFSHSEDEFILGKFVK